MIQQRKIYHFITLLLISAFLLGGCSQGTNLEMYSSKTKQKSKTPTNTEQQFDEEEDEDTDTTTDQNSSSNTNQNGSQVTSSDSAACISTRTKMNNVASACAKIIYDNREDLGSCYSKVSLLSDTNCNGIDNRLGQFKSACSSYLNQYRSMLPAACANAAAAL